MFWGLFDYLSIVLKKIENKKIYYEVFLIHNFLDKFLLNEILKKSTFAIFIRGTRQIEGLGRFEDDIFIISIFLEILF